MALTTRLTHDGKTLNICVDGRFDFQINKDFRRSYEQAGSSLTSYVIDLNATEYIDSSALGMLLTLRKHADGQGARIQIINTSENIRKLLKIANFQKLFNLS